MIRLLSGHDLGRFEAFLARHAASSMILRSNAAQSGLVDGPSAYEGLYLGVFENDALSGVAAHYWNGMIALQAPHHAARLAVELVRASGRKVAGFLGPWAQCQGAAAALKIEGAMRVSHPEALYELPLDALRVPQVLAAGDVLARQATSGELGFLIDWRLAYEIETLGAVHDDTSKVRAAETMTRHIASGDFWVVTQDHRIVAMAAISARVADLVQVGGVFTPPALRGRGYARAAVAAALLGARQSGAKTGILFTADTNAPAQRAYEALGFRHIGEYGLMLAKE